MLHAPIQTRLKRIKAVGQEKKTAILPRLVETRDILALIQMQ